MSNNIFWLRLKFLSRGISFPNIIDTSSFNPLVYTICQCDGTPWNYSMQLHGRVVYIYRGAPSSSNAGIHGRYSIAFHGSQWRRPMEFSIMSEHTTMEYHGAPWKPPWHFSSRDHRNISLLNISCQTVP